jgi:hypothetical protein
MIEAIFLLLHKRSYVALGQSGWRATEKGCLAVEQERCGSKNSKHERLTR